MKQSNNLKQSAGNPKAGQKKGFQGVQFLAVVILIYIVLYFVNQDKTLESLQHFVKNTLSVLPIFLFVIFLTAVINYYFPKERIGKMFQGKSKFRTYTISLLAGIISHGPVFVWYPLLKNLREKGVQDGALVTFLYGRNIKLTLLPIMIGFFGQLFTIIFMVYIAIAAIIQGLLYTAIDQFFEKKN